MDFVSTQHYKMTGKRNSAEQIANKQSKTRLKWTEAMNTKLLECKREAKDFVQLKDPPRKADEKKEGYMAIMKQLWDNSEFADLNISTQNRLEVIKANRIDGMIIDKTSKQERVIEMSRPWLENRESKDFEKTKKYSQLRIELTNRYPEYKVNQYNVIMDVLGGCSKDFEQNIKELVGDKCKSIMRQMHYTSLEFSNWAVRYL